MAINEGQTIQYTIVTSRVADGTVLYWQTTGNTTNSDITGGNTGSVTITNNRAVWNVEVIADASTDGAKTLGMSISTGSLSGPVVVTSASPISVTDSSRSPQYSLYFWGRNAPVGISGTNDSVDARSSPTQVGTSSWSKISVAHDFSVGVATNGTLWTWGTTYGGSSGLNILTAYRSSPTQVGALTTWLDVAAGGYHVAAIKTDGTLWTWGINSYGQLGLNNISLVSSPTQVGVATNWSSISAGFNNTFAIKTDGSLWALGRNYYGELGLGIGNSGRSSPTQVMAGYTWSLVATGKYSSGAITTDNNLWTWGYDSSYGNLGINASGNRSAPVQVNGSWSKFDISTNDTGFLAIKTNGTLWQCGYGYFIDGGANKSSPVQIGVATNWLNVYGAKNAGIATKTDSTAWVWGQNNWGGLGQNNTNYRIASNGLLQLGTAQWRNFASTKSSTNDQTVFGTTID